MKNTIKKTASIIAMAAIAITLNLKAQAAGHPVADTTKMAKKKMDKMKKDGKMMKGDKMSKDKMKSDKMKMSKDTSKTKM